MNASAPPSAVAQTLPASTRVVLTHRHLDRHGEGWQHASGLSVPWIHPRHGAWPFAKFTLRHVRHGARPFAERRSDGGRRKIAQGLDYLQPRAWDGPTPIPRITKGTATEGFAPALLTSVDCPSEGVPVRGPQRLLVDLAH